MYDKLRFSLPELLEAIELATQLIFHPKELGWVCYINDLTLNITQRGVQYHHLFVPLDDNVEFPSVASELSALCFIEPEEGKRVVWANGSCTIIGGV